MHRTLLLISESFDSKCVVHSNCSHEYVSFTRALCTCAEPMSLSLHYTYITDMLRKGLGTGRLSDLYNILLPQPSRAEIVKLLVALI